MLESFVRTHLNAVAQRRMAVLRPLEVVIDNWPTDDAGAPVVEQVELVNNPENADDGTRTAPFSGRFWIEQDDFKADPPPKYYRLTPGREVRLRGAFFVTCVGFDADADGTVERVHVTYDPETRGWNAPDGRKVKSTMHWVSADHAVDVQVALYERLFSAEVPGEATGDVFDDLEPGLTRACSIAARPSRHSPTRHPGRSSSSSASGTSPTIRTSRCCSTARSDLRDEWANIQKRSGLRELTEPNQRARHAARRFVDLPTPSTCELV